MVESLVYQFIWNGTSAVAYVCSIIVFIGLPNRLKAKLFEHAFGITNQSDEQQLIVNFYGIKINLLSSRRFRLSISFQLATIVWIIILTFVDGWILHLEKMFENDACPGQSSDCFHLVTLIHATRVECEPGHILKNLTLPRAVCFIWVYEKLDVMDIVNQIGICSSIFAILCHSFKWFCHLSRKWFGLCVIIFLAFGGVIVVGFSVALIIHVTITGLALLIGITVILINVIQLFQLTHSCQRKITHEKLAANVASTEVINSDANVTVPCSSHAAEYYTKNS